MKRGVKKIIYFLLVVILALIVVFFPKDLFKKIFSNSNIIEQPEDKKIISNPELEAQYEKNVKEIIASFEEKQKKPEEAKNAILDLRVPDKYKDIHLDLVVVFDEMVEGAKNSDQAAIEVALEKLNTIKEENEWIKQ